MTVYAFCFALGAAFAIICILGLYIGRQYFADRKAKADLAAANAKLNTVTVEEIRKRIGSTPLDNLVSSDDAGESNTAPKR